VFVAYIAVHLCTSGVFICWRTFILASNDASFILFAVFCRAPGFADFRLADLVHVVVVIGGGLPLIPRLLIADVLVNVLNILGVGGRLLLKCGPQSKP
jgi:hypothetical protein